MILNIVIKNEKSCIELYENITKYDESVQVFIGSTYKCAQHMAVNGIVISNNRIGNGRVFNKRNLDGFIEEYSIKEEYGKFLHSLEVKDEVIHSTTKTK